MQFSYFDTDAQVEKAVSRGVAALKSYRTHVRTVAQKRLAERPEYALAYAAELSLHETLDDLRQSFKGIQHLVLVGIGGSNLGTEAVHSVLDQGSVQLHTLDTIAPYQIKRLLTALSKVRAVNKIAICVVSKSGNTAETVVNASVLLDALEQRFGKAVYTQTIFIGNTKTSFMKAGKKLGVTCVAMPDSIGGRYSVATTVGLVPLALLGHDVDAFMGGILDSGSEEFESLSAAEASRLHRYLKQGYTHYNFFAFEPRLEKLGEWYRQLQAESLGKAKNVSGKKTTLAFVPTVSTAVELHSVGQLYFSGVVGTYTDFVVFDDDSIDYNISKGGIGKIFKKFTAQEVATGIYGGVIQAYQEKNLPYRSTIFDDGNLAYSLGLFMGMRMRETMYVASLLKLNAFNQPNVELYKEKTRTILGL